VTADYPVDASPADGAGGPQSPLLVAARSAIPAQSANQSRIARWSCGSGAADRFVDEVGGDNAEFYVFVLAHDA
jgi:hypothetical protein